MDPESWPRPSWATDDMVWVEDRSWRAPSQYHKCRHSTRPTCPNQPVADLKRGWPRGRVQWWAYCAEHMFGRHLEDGTVFFLVEANSPAAKRGWVD